MATGNSYKPSNAAYNPYASYTTTSAILGGGGGGSSYVTRDYGQGARFIQELLTTFTYKPAWNFSCGSFDTLHWNLMITMACEDTYHPGQQTLVGAHFVVPETFPHAAAAQQWLFDQIMTLERHEAQEWFKVGGKMPFDPHALSILG